MCYGILSAKKFSVMTNLVLNTIADVEIFRLFFETNYVEPRLAASLSSELTCCKLNVQVASARGQLYIQQIVEPRYSN